MNGIHYTSKGSGFPLILIHGFCETSQIWDPFIEFLGDDLQIIAVDLPGFGKSGSNQQDSLENIATRLNNWVSEQGFTKPLIIGHSLGGYIVLAMLATQPKMFSGIGLFHSTALADTEIKRLNRIRAMDFVKVNGVVAFVKSFIPSLFFNKDQAAIDFALRIAQNTSEMAFLNYSAAMRDRPDRRDVIEKTEVPILIIAGKEDTVVPVESLAEQAKLNKHITFKVMSGVGHMGMLEAAKSSANVVNAFINKVKSRVNG